MQETLQAWPPQASPHSRYRRSRYRPYRYRLPATGATAMEEAGLDALRTKNLVPTPVITALKAPPFSIKS
eukprot:5072367-Heterocapsa_arctica.AAC.1